MSIFLKSKTLPDADALRIALYNSNEELDIFVGKATQLVKKQKL